MVLVASAYLFQVFSQKFIMQGDGKNMYCVQMCVLICLVIMWLRD